ncbi:mitochondrial ribosomal protein L9 [Lycorma delicatula]|uniref:mitochondrial ribosomal protein L9 n=1 Tax=Lycorma delicatula TaxID=130591 RepID=UPI003F50E5D3
MLKAFSLLKQFSSIQNPLNSAKVARNLLSAAELTLVKIPNRTTFILKRKHTPRLLRKYVDQTKWKPFKKRERVYQLVQDTDVLPEGNIDVILTSYIQGLGEKGDVVTVKRNYAYNQLLLPGLAEYATPEAKEMASRKEKRSNEVIEERYSGIHVHRTMNFLSNLILCVTMNKENKWVLEPWHIKASFRKAGVHLSEDCIEMPKNKIEGPDLNLEDKEFLVTVIINKKEKVKVRCRLHHWSTDIVYRLPHVPLHWTKSAEPLFNEESELLLKMPIPSVPKTKET